jgi:hypothetical protein
MAIRKMQKPEAERPRKTRKSRDSSGGERSDATGGALLEATHRVIEDEVRRGEAPATPEPDQKGEPGSSV